MSTEEREKQIREREAKATKGPWNIRHEINLSAPDPRGGFLCPLTNSSLDKEQRVDNYAFAAHARADIPWLLSQLEGTRREIEAFKKESAR